MGGLTRFAAVLLAGAALASCKGGEGQPCNSGGPFGPLTCDPGLVCNGADSDTCERPGSRHENQSCDSTQLCAAGLWCDFVARRCEAFLSEGAACSDPFSCGPDLSCQKNLETMRGATCQQPLPEPDGGVDGGVTGATVTGTLTLPDSAPAGTKGSVALYTTLPPAGTAVAESGLAATGGTSVDYRIVGVPAGSYFILGFFDLDHSGGTSSTPGDFAGWYGHNGDGNPPAAASAVVPDSGTVRFDISLVVR